MSGEVSKPGGKPGAAEVRARATVATRMRGGLRCERLVSISGMSVRGKHFTEPAETGFVSREGCTVLTFQTLGPSDEIDLRYETRETRVRIVGQVGLEDRMRLYAAEFVAPVPDFWGVPLPSVECEKWSVEAHCAGCGADVKLRVSNIEVMVFELLGNLHYCCPVCRTHGPLSSTGKRPLPAVMAEVPVKAPAAPVAIRPIAVSAAESAAPSNRTINERKCVRLRFKNTKACIKSTSGQEDVVDVCDYSRGGLRFTSRMMYAAGMMIQVAIPYTLGANNVYVRAKLVRVQRRATQGVMGEYAARLLLDGDA